MHRSTYKERGVDVIARTAYTHTQDHEKRSAMHAAAYCGETECLSALVMAGKSMNDHLSHVYLTMCFLPVDLVFTSQIVSTHTYYDSTYSVYSFIHRQIQIHPTHNFVLTSAYPPLLHTHTHTHTQEVRQR